MARTLSAQTQPDKENNGQILVALLLFVAAFAIRSLPWQFVFSTGKVYLYDPDCYVRLRKILVYLASYPATFIYDYFQGFPHGTGVISSPAMEYFLATLFYPLSKILNIGRLLPITVALIPPMTGAATVVVLYRLMRNYFSSSASILAALLLAILPMHVEATMLGRFDNEMLEPLLFLIIIGRYLRSYGDDRRSAWLFLGLWQASYLMIWRGALFPLAIIGIDIVWRILGRNDRDRVKGSSAATMYGATALVMLLICISNAWGTRLQFSFNVISWFHVALFCGAAAICYFLDRLRSAFSSRNSATAMLLLIAGMVVLAAAGLLFRSHLLQGIQVITGGNPWIDTIAQYQGGLKRSTVLLNYGLLSFLSLAALPILWNKQFAHLPWRRFLLIWTVTMFVALVARRRFALYYALNSALLSGVVVHYLQALLADGRQRLGLTVAIGCTFLLLQAPTYPFYANIFHNGFGTIQGDIEETMTWLREKTPTAGDPYHPDKKPAYGVLAHWDYGGWIEAVAQRPTLTTNYGTETYGMEEAAAFFVSSNENEMGTILRRNGIRYLLIDNIIASLPMYAGLAQVKQQYVVERLDPKRKTMVSYPAKEAFSLIPLRLFFADGTQTNGGGISFQPVEGVRLVFESASPAPIYDLPWEIKRIKLFEFTDGATLTVKGAPGRAVTLSQTIETNQGRRFDYRNEKVLAADGTSRFALLYPSKTKPDQTGAVGPVSVTVAGQTRSLVVSGQDIETKRSFELIFR